jgi:protein TonB
VLVASSDSPASIRRGEPPRVPPDVRPRLPGWLALSALIHAAGFAAALAWSERQDSVPSDPIPIAWVRVEPREEAAAPAPPGVPAPAPPPAEAAPPLAPLPPPPRRAIPPRPPPPVRAAPPAPSMAPAVAVPVPAEPDASPSDVIEPPATPTAQAAVASGPGTNGAAPSGHAAGAYGAGGNGASGGASGAGATAGLATGWMPAGGVQRAPMYPESARRRGIEGTAQVALRLAASGRVDEVRLHRTSGDPGLDGAALASVRRWRFDPPPPGAEWRGVWFLVPIEFRLR